MPVIEAEPPDQDLVERSTAGEALAFEALFHRHFTAVYRYAMTLAQDQAEAEDLTQEAFIRAHTNLGRLGPPWRARECGSRAFERRRMHPSPPPRGGLGGPR